MLGIEIEVKSGRLTETRHHHRIIDEPSTASAAEAPHRVLAGSLAAHARLHALVLVLEAMKKQMYNLHWDLIITLILVSLVKIV